VLQNVINYIKNEKMKTYIILLIIGMIVVIIGVFLKINRVSEYSNYLLSLGMILELISVFGIVKSFKNRK
jgi:Na+/alanine symporter